jgi:hypothetical protein
MVVHKAYLILFLDKSIYDKIELPKGYVPCYGDEPHYYYDLIVGNEDLDYPNYFKSNNIDEILERVKSLGKKR